MQKKKGQDVFKHSIIRFQNQLLSRYRGVTCINVVIVMEIHTLICSVKIQGVFISHIFKGYHLGRF